MNLREELFKHRFIKRLRKVAGGDTFLIIYIKLLQKSENNSGLIEMERFYDFQDLALDIDEQVQNVQAAFKLLGDLGLIIKTYNGWTILTPWEAE